jgi:hypothetical protein
MERKFVIWVAAVLLMLPLLMLLMLPLLMLMLPLLMLMLPLLMLPLHAPFPGTQSNTRRATTSLLRVACLACSYVSRCKITLMLLAVLVQLMPKKRRQ